MRPRRRWVIYREMERKYSPIRRYFRFLDEGRFDQKLFHESIWVTGGTLYDTKKDAETAALLFVTSNESYIGKLKVTHTEK